MLKRFKNGSFNCLDMMNVFFIDELIFQQFMKRTYLVLTAFCYNINILCFIKEHYSIEMYIKK